GKLDLDGRGTVAIINVPFKMIQVEEMQIPINPPGHGTITGKVTALDDWSADFTANQAAFSAANPCPLAGAVFTMILPGVPGSVTVPDGDGFARVTVNGSGAG